MCFMLASASRASSQCQLPQLVQHGCQAVAVQVVRRCFLRLTPIDRINQSIASCLGVRSANLGKDLVPSIVPTNSVGAGCPRALPSHKCSTADAQRNICVAGSMYCLAASVHLRTVSCSLLPVSGCCQQVLLSCMSGSTQAAAQATVQ